MEIHPPEKPIHTVRDFLLQLMTITAGILIALSLEGAIEWSQHRTLVSEVKAPDIVWVARLGAAADPDPASVKPLYLRAADAKPQTAGVLPRQ